MKRFDRFLYGFIVGIIAPAIVAVGIILTGEFEGSFWEVLIHTHTYGFLGVLIRPALLANLAIFVLFFNLNYMRLCRGLIISTLVYGAYMLLQVLF